MCTRITGTYPLHTRINHRFVCDCKDCLFSVMNCPKLIVIPDIVVEPRSKIFLWDEKQLLSDVCASLQSRRDSLPAASRPDHRCPPPLRFHHVRWQSLGVRARPCLAPLARHVEDNFFFNGFMERALFPFFSREYRVYFRSNFRHELVLVVTKNGSRGYVFCCVFLGGCWVDSRAVCVAVSANSW